MNDERERETPNSAAEWFVRIDSTARDPEVDAQLEALDSSIARMLSQVRKCGEAKLIATHSTAMMSSSPASRMLASLGRARAVDCAAEAAATGASSAAVAAKAPAAPAVLCLDINASPQR